MKVKAVLSMVFLSLLLIVWACCIRRNSENNNSQEKNGGRKNIAKEIQYEDTETSIKNQINDGNENGKESDNIYNENSCVSEVIPFRMPEEISLMEFEELSYNLFIRVNFDQDSSYSLSDPYLEFCILDNQTLSWYDGIEKYIEENKKLNLWNYEHIVGNEYEDWERREQREHIERIIDISPDNHTVITAEVLQRGSDAAVYKTYVDGKIIKESQKKPEKVVLYNRVADVLVPLQDAKNDSGRLNSDGTFWMVMEADGIKIYNISDGNLFWEYDDLSIVNPAIEYMDDIFQFEGDSEKGFITFSNDRKAYKLTYPEGELTELGNYMYFPCVSPDGKYVAYSIGGTDNWRDRGWDNFEVLFEEAGLRDMQAGVYIKELKTGKTAFIKFTDTSENMYEINMKWLEKQ